MRQHELAQGASPQSLPLGLVAPRVEVHAQVMGDRALANRVRMGEASGMVSIQAHCSVTEAVGLMRRRAESSGETLEEVMIAVLQRSIRFGA